MSGGVGNGFDWPALMQAGLRGLGLRPEDFWRLTPAELRLLLGDGVAAAQTLGRRRLDELLAAYPDVRAQGEGHYGRPE